MSERMPQKAIYVGTPGLYIHQDEVRASGALPDFIDLPILENLTLARVLKYYRWLYDLTPAQLADRANIQKCQISNIETGKILKPRSVTIDKLTDVFGEKFKALVYRISSSR